MSIIDTITTSIQPYLMWIKVAAIAAVFLSGCYVTHLYYNNQISDAVIAKQKLEIALKDATNKITIKFVKDTQVITIKGAERILKVVEYVNVPGECKQITAGFVEYHNAAVENRSLTPMTEDNAKVQTKSTVEDLALTINANYSQCNKYRAQIEALQELLLEIKRSRE